MPDSLTHLDEQGRARMVDVGAKPVTRREAVAEGFITLQPATLRAVAAIPSVLAPHEAFALAFGPGECLFHRFALMVTQAHLGERGLRVDLLRNLGRRG